MDHISEYTELEEDGSHSLSRMESAVDEALQHHMNSAATIVSDERDYLRPWRRRLRDMLTESNAKLLNFLEAVDDEAGLDTLTRHEDFINTLARRDLPSGSSWHSTHLQSVIRNEDVLSELDKEIGFTLTETRDRVHEIMNTYLTCVKELFACDEKIHATLDKLEALKTRIESVVDLEDSARPEVTALQSSILDYIKSKYDSFDLAVDYKEFCRQYACFTALRSVILALKVAEDTSAGPLCSICTQEKTQVALVPCGHTFCGNCAIKQRSQCYICRSTVRDKLRLYFT